MLSNHSSFLLYVIHLDQPPPPKPFTIDTQPVIPDLVAGTVAPTVITISGDPGIDADTLVFSTTPDPGILIVSGIAIAEPGPVVQGVVEASGKAITFTITPYIRGSTITITLQLAIEARPTTRSLEALTEEEDHHLIRRKDKADNIWPTATFYQLHTALALLKAGVPVASVRNDIRLGVVSHLFIMDDRGLYSAGHERKRNIMA